MIISFVLLLLITCLPINNALMASDIQNVDGLNKLSYFDDESHKNQNDALTYKDILPAPVFSKSGGFYSNDIQLEITHADPEAVIIYTLDGSDPCIDNLSGTTYYYKNEYSFHPGMPFGELLEAEYTSLIYNEKINITDRSGEQNKISNISSTVHEAVYVPDYPVFKGTVVRARAYKDGYLPGEIATNTYFITPQGNQRFSLPVISISIQEDFLYDYNIGIYTAGVVADNWRIDNPDESFSWPFRGNFRRRGDEYEYPANIELFKRNSNKVGLNQQVGIRIHGGGTRSFPMKSLRLYARSIYGISTLDFPVFENSPQTEFKRLILRNSGQDFPTDIWEPGLKSRTMFRDAAMQQIFCHMRFDTQNYQPVILFINGEYWGLLNIRERYDKHYLERNYDVDPDNIDLLTSKDMTQEGDNVHYKETISYIEEHGLSDFTHYDYISTRIDIDNFIDYQIANIYARNTDWPGNNIDFWRLRTDGFIENTDYGHDGRWRWLMFDLDFGFGLWGGDESYKHNTLEFATEEGNTAWPNPDWSTFLLRSFLENELFRTSFINRYADLLNTGLSTKRTQSVIRSLKEDIAPEINEHFTRWGYPGYFEKWQENVEVMFEFVEKRPDIQRRQIKDYFDIEGLIDVTLDVSNQLKGHIRINTIDILPSTPGVEEYPYPWSGKYFAGIPLEIEAVAAPGYRFTHWEGDATFTDNILSIISYDELYLKAHFESTNEQVLFHYWMFDTNIPNDTPLEYLESFYSANSRANILYYSSLDGYPYYEGHENWRKASMERRNQPTSINYRPEGNNDIPYSENNMRGLQVRQPFMHEGNKNYMVFDAPTTGFYDVVFSFVAMDEGAAEKIIIEYCVDSQGANWQTAGLEQSVFSLESDYQYYEISFESIEEVNNNPDFKIRLGFDGDYLEQDEGNRVTFNNISFDGRALEAFTIFTSYSGHGTVVPKGNIPVYVGDSRDFKFIPNHNHQVSDIIANGESHIDNISINEDNSVDYSYKNVFSDCTLYVIFTLDEEILGEFDDGIVVYPNPANDRFTVSSIDEIEEIVVTNIRGQIVSVYSNINSKEAYINSAGYEKGFYILIVQTENAKISSKLNIIR